LRDVALTSLHRGPKRPLDALLAESEQFILKNPFSPPSAIAGKITFSDNTSLCIGNSSRKTSEKYAVKKQEIFFRNVEKIVGSHAPIL